MNEVSGKSYGFSYADGLLAKLKKLKNKDKPLYSRLQRKIIGIIDNPLLGKPLRNVLKNRRRIHIGSFVLIYEIFETQKEIRFLDFEHHNKAYKKRQTL